MSDDDKYNIKGGEDGSGVYFRAAGVNRVTALGIVAWSQHGLLKDL